MVSNIIRKPIQMRKYGQTPYYVEISCLSSDTKPTANIATGSLAIEADTGDVYLFDEVGMTWNKMCSIKE